VAAKLAAKVPPVTPEEVEQCFANRTKLFLIDDREENRTDPPTRWFIAETDFGRKLKVSFVPRGADMYLKSAYDPKQEWIDYYENYHK
jgi:hypothetical protein